LTIAGLAGALALAPVPALAQEAQPGSNAPPADAVGPRELQNFSLQGNVTRPADQPAQPAAAPAATSAAGDQPSAAPRRTRDRAQQRAEAPAVPRRTADAAPRQAAVSGPPPAPVAQSDIAPLPTTPAPLPTTTSSSAFAPATPDESTGTLAPEHRFSLLPWILAAIALAAGGAFLFWRNRHRPAFAGAPGMDMFAAPKPAPRPAPPTPPRAAPAPPVPPKAEPAPPRPEPTGIVSTSLRPWIDISAQPLRCTVTDDSVTIEFELELFNSGSAPARNIQIEAVVVNAGDTQDQELAAFFSRAPGSGNPIEVIHPLTRTAFTTQVVTSREHISVLEAGGRQVFVPLLAFNAFYRRGSASAQTSVAYLLGRETNGGKMAPFRIDQGPRVFRGLGARPLPNGVRR
jgi:hypothetical protein